MEIATVNHEYCSCDPIDRLVAIMCKTLARSQGTIEPYPGQIGFSCSHPNDLHDFGTRLFVDKSETHENELDNELELVHNFMKPPAFNIERWITQHLNPLY